MPYRNAYVLVLALLVLTFVAFWPSYLKDLPAAKHAHGTSTQRALSSGPLLAALQSWIDSQRPLGARTGMRGWPCSSSFPFFLVAGVWVIHLEATTLAGGLADPKNVEIAQIGIVDLLANGRLCHTVLGRPEIPPQGSSACPLHAGHTACSWSRRSSGACCEPMSRCSMSTSFRSRYVFRAVATPYLIAFALYLYWQAPKHGRPWLLVAGIIAAQEILFETLGRVAGWAPIFSRIAYANLPLLLTLTGIVSLGHRMARLGSGRPADRSESGSDGVTRRLARSPRIS